MSTPICRECGNAVSAGAAACPHCGVPYPAGGAPRRSNAWVLVLLGGGVLVPFLVVGVGFFFGWRDGMREARERRPEEIVDYQEVPPSATNAPPVERSAPPDPDTYELSAVDVQPELLGREALAAELRRLYPPLLRDAGITGRATVRMRVRADGGVDAESIEILDSTYDMFGQAARLAAQRMRFTPAQAGGRPVAVWVVIPVDFQLES